MPPDESRYVFRVFVAWLLLLLLLISFFAGRASANERLARYLLLEGQFQFSYNEALPYSLIRPMCWDESLGWCDDGMDERGWRLAYLVDLETGFYATAMKNHAGCWLWWMNPEIGEDGQPHVAESSWIECP